MNHLMTTAGDAQFVTLGIGQETFAAPVESVLEILDLKPLVRLPDAPAYVAGLLDVRGRAVPVINLRLKLGLPSVQATESTRILVLEVEIAGNHRVLGLIADRVIEVATFQANQVEPPPDIGLNWRSDYIRGVAHSPKGFVIIFDLSRLFSSEEAAFLGAAPAPAE